MSNDTTPPPAPYAAQPPIAPAPAKRGNALGIVALILGVAGFVFAVIPGALVVGWILLPAAFVLGIVALCLRGRSKWAGITAIIVSVVGTIAGIIAFTAMAANAFSDAFDEASGGETSVVDESQPADADASDGGEESAAGSSRENPLPLGSTISNDDWQVTVNSVDLAAGDAIAAENPFNEAAPDGQQYILVNVTETYVGDDSDMAAMNTVNYVTPDGVTVDGTSALVVAPDALDVTSTLYNGGSVTGNVALAVPADTAADGTIAVTLSLLGDPFFFATA